MVQRLELRASSAGVIGLIPGWGTKIPPVAWCSQKGGKKDQMVCISAPQARQSQRRCTSSHRQHTYKWVWPVSNKTLFTKQAVGQIWPMGHKLTNPGSRFKWNICEIPAALCCVSLYKLPNFSEPQSPRVKFSRIRVPDPQCWCENPHILNTKYFTSFWELSIPG